ncbi:MAG: hypothetical protein A3H27_10805 [Acidobacteria bacterium RIFCSPLOWO2_02_FULL_59_13]|nr:MAG: hypothetical protein A3H27_10805 [Acidobacteria bacterium RIFCSPLOWO2_02_FULL_59_13]OGA60798.1 MAG: hypothetical protein A3G81_23765 [Betaproteobacteria bacterium RIFCSPLOWO2_12_FULL_65_14]
MRGSTAITRAIESTAVNTFSLVDEPPVVVRAEGATLWDEGGRAYIDMVCGSGVSNFGHGVAWQREAVERVLRTGYLHTGTRLPSPFRADFYSELVDILPAALDTVHLLNSGAEAMETALKAAQYATGRSGVISFYGAYHGRTTGALAVTASKRAHQGFDGRPFDVQFFPYPYASRPPLLCANPQSLGEACLHLLREALRNPVSGMRAGSLVVEAVQGVSGVVIPPSGFVTGLRELCNEFGLVMIVDEIWNGFGRCGQWFAFARDGVVPDLVTFGKAASASFPLGGVAGRNALLTKWKPGAHTSTFQGNPVACAVAAENIRQCRARRLLDRCRDWVEPALRSLAQRALAIRGVAEFRVIGAQLGLELNTPDGLPDKDRLRAVQLAALRRGVLVYGGGWYSNVLMLVPPLTITSAEFEQAQRGVLEALEETV